MAARDKREQRGSEAAAGRGERREEGARDLPVRLAHLSAPPPPGRRPPTADRRSPGARRPRHTRTGREGGAGAGARPARTSGGGRRGAGWRRAAAAPSRFGPENVSNSRLRRPNAPSRSHENTQLLLPGLEGSPAPRARPRTHPPGPPTGNRNRRSLTSWNRSRPTGRARRPPGPSARPLLSASPRARASLPRRLCLARARTPPRPVHASRFCPAIPRALLL